MDAKQARTLLKQNLAAIEGPGRVARTDEFAGLRQVDAKVRDVRMVIGALPGFGESLAREMAADLDFEANSRRVRLEALANYCRTALQLLDAGVIPSGKKQLIRAPKDLAKITGVMPDLNGIIQERWLEAQKCQHAGAYLAAGILMGSILEGLLLARANLAPADAFRANAAPKRKDGTQLPLHDWTLSSLIDVSAELKWIKIDRKSFSHALRDSRNVVHPWHQVRTGADFDQATCAMCWQVLRASVRDLIASI